MNSAARRILVTGGAGFVGSHLTDRLASQGYKVTVLDDLSSGLRDNIHADARFVEGDVCDNILVGRLIAENDACFHLAAIASVQACETSWVRAHAVNQAAFTGLLEAAAKRETGPIPVVYASSAAIYGDAETLPAHEGLPPHPISIYGADKAGCELQAKAAGAKGVPTFGLRPFNIYGPRQNPSSPYSGVISIFADRLKRGEGITIYGDGAQTRDFIHVADIVDFFLAALDKASPDAPVCNAASGKETSILTVAQRLAALLGREAPQIAYASARKGDIYRSVADISHAQKLLDRTASLSVDQGLEFILQA